MKNDRKFGPEGYEPLRPRVNILEAKHEHYASQLNEAFGMIAALEQQAEAHRAQIESLLARVEAIAPIRSFRVLDQETSKPAADGLSAAFRPPPPNQSGVNVTFTEYTE